MISREKWSPYRPLLCGRSTSRMSAGRRILLGLRPQYSAKLDRRDRLPCVLGLLSLIENGVRLGPRSRRTARLKCLGD